MLRDGGYDGSIARFKFIASIRNLSVMLRVRKVECDGVDSARCQALRKRHHKGMGLIRSGSVTEHQSDSGQAALGFVYDSGHVLARVYRNRHWFYCHRNSLKATMKLTPLHAISIIRAVALTDSGAPSFITALSESFSAVNGSALIKG